MEHPLLTLLKAAELRGLSFPAVSSAMALLTNIGVAREITGRKRNRVFAYQEYVEALNERQRCRYLSGVNILKDWKVQRHWGAGINPVGAWGR